MATSWRTVIAVIVLMGMVGVTGAQESALVFSDKVRVRSGPGTDAPVVRTVSCHESVLVWETRGSMVRDKGVLDLWHRISDTEAEWINAMYVVRFPFSMLDAKGNAVTVESVRPGPKGPIYCYRRGGRSLVDTSLVGFIRDNPRLRLAEFLRVHGAQGIELGLAENPADGGVVLMYGIQLGRTGFFELKDLFGEADLGNDRGNFGYIIGEGSEERHITFLTSLDPDLGPGPDTVVYYCAVDPPQGSTR